MYKLSKLVLIILLTTCLPLFATDYWVDADNGSDSNTGATAEDAFRTITYAVDQASPDKANPVNIIVKPGNYNTKLGESFPIYLKSYLTITGYTTKAEQSRAVVIDATGTDFGVFSGGKLQYVTLTNLTIQGGGDSNTYGGGIRFDNTDNISIKDCIIKDCTGDLGGGSHFSFCTNVTISKSEFLDNRSAYGGGIIFNNSSGEIKDCSFKSNWVENTDPESRYGGLGGGIFLEDSSPDVKDSTFENNRAIYGGGVNCYSSSPKIENCTFDGNYAEIYEDSGGFGGGLSSQSYASPQLYNTTFEDNTALYGGGVYCASETEMNVEHCYFYINHAAVGNGGGLYAYATTIDITNTMFKENWNESADSVGGYGGGVCLSYSYPKLEDNIFDGNRADYGGGLALLSTSVDVLSSIFVYNYTEGPTAEGGYGGGVYFNDSSGAKLINCLLAANNAYQGGAAYSIDSSNHFTNVTISKNNAEEGSGIYFHNEYDPNILNSIVWDNDIFGTANVNYSCIEGGYKGEGNIDKDPLFLPGHQGYYYYLSHKAAGQPADSPCVDAGTTWKISLGFSPYQYTTRTDGLMDDGIADMGYHQQPHVRFGLIADPAKEAYTLGDEMDIKLDLLMATSSLSCDVYFVLLDPAGNIFFGFAWDTKPKTLVSNLYLTGGVKFLQESILNFTIPATNPPINAPGNYTFAIGATNPGTMDFISNIATVFFPVE